MYGNYMNNISKKKQKTKQKGKVNVINKNFVNIS